MSDVDPIELHLEPHDPTREELAEALRLLLDTGAALGNIDIESPGLQAWSRAVGILAGYDLCAAKRAAIGAPPTAAPSATPTMTVWVLLKERVPARVTADTGAAEVVGVYADRDVLLGRVDRMARTNRQYPMRRLGDNGWIIGPEGDEGFFGHQPMELRAVECAFYPAGV